VNTYEYLLARVRSYSDAERGAALVEYALLLAFIAVICIAAVSFLGSELSDRFDSIGGSVEAGNPN
jgi:pilus assembly protein Flp/PilA